MWDANITRGSNDSTRIRRTISPRNAVRRLAQGYSLLRSCTATNYTIRMSTQKVTNEHGPAPLH